VSWRRSSPVAALMMRLWVSWMSSRMWVRGAGPADAGVVEAAAVAEGDGAGGATAIGLTVCAAAGLAFYVALGVIVFQLIASLVAAIAAVGSIIFSWAGLAMVVGDAGITTGMIIAAVTALAALLGVQAQQMVALHGTAVDDTAFPGGHWPVAANLGS